ncbi:MAG: FHA domain-containing protein [Oligoflexia bacterium]|nr:FHA domain-containing protein [Oligoflexia bacterium]
MLRQRQIEEIIFELTSYNNGEVLYNFKLDKKKLLVGRCPNADIFIDHPSVSFYHALVIVDENGGKIIDLESENGILINGQSAKNTFFASGDEIIIGNVPFNVGENYCETSASEPIFKDQDEGQVVKIRETDQVDINNLPPLPGLVVIDGEYCDITFDDDAFTPINNVKAYESEEISENYVDYQEKREVEPIARKSKDLAIEVMVMSNGHILDIEYYSFNQKTIYISQNSKSNNTFKLESLDNDKRIPFIEISNGQVQINSLENFQSKNVKTGEDDLFKKSSTISLDSEESITFYRGTVQVFVKLTDAPPILRYAPFFGRDVEFQKQAAKIFGSIMSFMLLFLLVDTTVDPPKKKISVIYRKAVKSPQKSNNKSKTNADKINKDLGIKKENQKKPENKMAKKSVKKKTKVKKKVVKKAPAKKSSAQKKIKKVAKMKAYKFNSSKSFSSFFSGKSAVNPKNLKANTSATSFSNSSAVSDTSSDSLESNTPTNIESMGKDFAGNYDTSSGLKGMASKSGVDTTYSDQKTVVLGSMDPELLRKILREYLPQFRHCYQKELEVNEAAKGVIDLNFRIGAGGKVSNINIKSKGSAFSSRGTNCMSKVLGLIPFPKPKGGGVVDVRQPLNFFSEKDSY